MTVGGDDGRGVEGGKKEGRETCYSVWPETFLVNLYNA